MFKSLSVSPSDTFTVNSIVRALGAEEETCEKQLSQTQNKRKNTGTISLRARVNAGEVCIEESASLEHLSPDIESSQVFATHAESRLAFARS